MGFKIFKAVRKDKLALYINPLSPIKLTIRTLVLHFVRQVFATLWQVSLQTKKVLAIILKFSIYTINVNCNTQLQKLKEIQVNLISILKLITQKYIKFARSELM